MIKFIKNIKRLFTYKSFIFVSLLVLISLSLLIKFDFVNIAYIVLFSYWAYSTVLSLYDIESKGFVLILNLTLFTFVLSRPLINILNGNQWYFSNYILKKVIFIIYTSEFFITVGSFFSKKIPSSVKIAPEKSKRIGSFICYILCISFLINMYTGIINYIDLKSIDYASIYTNNAHQFNVFIRIFSNIFPFAVCAYLSLMPSKRNSLLCLVMYLVSSIPMFLLGSRNELVLRLLFFVVYYFIRFIINNNEKWISKKKILIILILLPLFISYLGAYNYIRDKKKVSSLSIVDLSLDFFHKQGTTFDTICQGVKYEKKLKNDFNVISYTFGDLIDYTLHNSISIKLFKTESFGHGNNLNVIKHGNSMAHNISYIVLGKESYLSGHGRGTSYLLETYIDFGFLGLAIYSFLIGLFLSCSVWLIKKNNFILTMIILTSLTQIFLIPRYSSVGFISFIITPQFWIIPFLVFIYEKLMKKVGVI